MIFGSFFPMVGSVSSQVFGCLECGWRGRGGSHEAPGHWHRGAARMGHSSRWSRCGRSSGSSRRYGRNSSSNSISSSRGGWSRCTVADAGRAHSVTHCRTWLPGSNGGQRQRELEISKKPACLFNSLLSQLPFQFQPLMIHA